MTTQNAIGASQILFNPAIAFTVGFMLLFSIVIALFKVRVDAAKGSEIESVREVSVHVHVCMCTVSRKPRPASKRKQNPTSHTTTVSNA